MAKKRYSCLSRKRGVTYFFLVLEKWVSSVIFPFLATFVLTSRKKLPRNTGFKSEKISRKLGTEFFVLVSLLDRGSLLEIARVPRQKASFVSLQDWRATSKPQQELVFCIVFRRLQGITQSSRAITTEWSKKQFSFCTGCPNQISVCTFYFFAVQLVKRTQW